jgi:hypothetical protein
MMLALLVLWVATLGRELAILAPYAAAILLVTTVTT